MIWAIFGLFIGGAAGFMTAALWSAGKEADQQMQQREMCKACMDAMCKVQGIQGATK